MDSIHDYRGRKGYAKIGSWQYKFVKKLVHWKGGSSMPDHLTYKLHNDWPWPLSYLPRELNAFGWRSGKWWASWRMYPMVLLGWNCPRWMRFDDSVAYKSEYTKWVFFKSHPDCGVSPLQKLSKFSWHIAWPLHFSLSWKLWGNHVLLIRIGCRWDSLDQYYNIGPYIGLAWN